MTVGLKVVDVGDSGGGGAEYGGEVGASGEEGGGRYEGRVDGAEGDAVGCAGASDVVGIHNVALLIGRTVSAPVAVALLVSGIAVRPGSSIRPAPPKPPPPTSRPLCLPRGLGNHCRLATTTPTTSPVWFGPSESGAVR